MFVKISQPPVPPPRFCLSERKLTTRAGVRLLISLQPLKRTPPAAASGRNAVSVSMLKTVAAKDHAIVDIERAVIKGASSDRQRALGAAVAPTCELSRPEKRRRTITASMVRLALFSPFSVPRSPLVSFTHVLTLRSSRPSSDRKRPLTPSHLAVALLRIEVRMSDGNCRRSSSRRQPTA